MLPPSEAQEALRRCLQSRLVVDLAPLLQAIGTRCRVTVFRRLREVGYRTSFTHGGRYYALADTPRFDEHGLWFLRGIGFSRVKGLRATISELIEKSPAGLSYGELGRLTTVRVENALSALVRQGNCQRVRVGQQSIYVGRDPGTATDQARRREEQAQAGRTRALPAASVLDVLLEVIRAGGVYVPPRTVTVRLMARGVAVGESQVSAIYAEHGLVPGKKTARARRSKS